jgi:hypothetical protein
MVARCRSATFTTARLTREVLRIRQPARTPTDLIELEMQRRSHMPERLPGEQSCDLP